MHVPLPPVFEYGDYGPSDDELGEYEQDGMIDSTSELVYDK